MRFPAKIAAIYFIEKTGFDNKNNHKAGKPAYLRIANN